MEEANAEEHMMAQSQELWAKSCGAKSVQKKRSCRISRCSGVEQRCQEKAEALSQRQTPVEIKAAVISPEGIDLYSSRRSEKSAKLPPQEFLFIKPDNRQKDKKPEILRASKSALNYSALLCFRST